MDNVFNLKANIYLKKHKLMVRKIISKMILKYGTNYVYKVMPEAHRPMISYIEKVKRKKVNKKRERLVIRNS